MSAKHEDAALILRLYELRREEVMRQARRWFIGFTPESMADFQKVFTDEKASAYFRMVVTYWEMACSLVNNGAIDEQMFNDANGEHVAIFSKIEPFLADLRAFANSPDYLRHFERLIRQMPEASARLAAMRERMKLMAAARRAAEAAGSSTAPSS